MRESISQNTINNIKSYSKEIKNSEIARALWVSVSSVYKYRKETKEDIKENLKQDNYTEDLNKKHATQNLTILKKKYGDVLEKLDEQEKMFEVFEEVKKKQWIVKIEKNPKWESTQSVANLVFSDLHVEEQVDPDMVHWLNEYNPQIAQERSKIMFTRFSELVSNLKQSENIHWVIIHLLGDFISWYIHPELIEWNAMSPTEAILLCKQIICSWIDHILETTDEPITVATAIWNHWRTTDKSRVSTWWKNSYEWLMYNVIAQHYENNPRVNFKIEKWNINYINVYDKVMADMHGDMVRYQWGVGWVTIPLNKATAQWQRAKHADLYNLGHFHQLRDWGLWVTNWSVIGYNNYAESIKADYEEPKQLMYLFNSKYGKTITSPIILKV